ncbi:phosphatase PAP2 family protein [Allomesorhizobium camelthorni]|uniref:Inositolphosphotransferase Aur1/Ipt1 domain-containing protein n=1 Tax=Allomesorhizobium camelthorni TaxID=475069 RepID=A0A6G4WA43_9HYPH|nr:hypothetical protein [Mesorhizobium camelthorni]
MRGDAGLYLLVVAYTALGLLALSATGRGESAAYGVYVAKWFTLFGFLFPVLNLLLVYAIVIHRVDRRRTLALRLAFSTERLACLVAGVALLLSMMLFQGTYTSLKNALPHWQGGFPHDRLQADIDRWLHFGVDPWIWLYRIGEHDLVRLVLEWNYNVLWFALCFGALFYVATSPRTRRMRTRYLVCFMLVWVVCGNLLAGLFLSAGPAFYGAVTGDEGRFAAQLAFLAHGAQSTNSAVTYQTYLWSLHQYGTAGFGSGISAFPSVHVALAALNALFLWDHSSRLGLAAFAYVAVIVASSVYLAWHYAIDGYASIAIVAVIYFGVKHIEAWATGERQAHSFLSATSSTR